MGKEIERKFLVTGDAWRAGKGIRVRQGYISRAEGTTVRVRSTPAGGYLTVKGARHGITRSEFEYEIPLEDAEEILDSVCVKPLIEKVRYVVAYRGLTWEVDEFFGENEGLVIAELELESEDQGFEKPDWIGEEVTGDPRYYNANPVANPYSKW